MKIVSAGIIAAGEGSRFKKSGISLHKPMIPVAGFPLIWYTLKNFETIGIRRVVIIFNESERDCVRWVRKNFPGIHLEIIVKSTNSSYESFMLVGKKLGKGRHLISTVDSLTLPREVRKMCEISMNSLGNVYLGVTRFVDDEKPLWIKMNKRSRRITAIGSNTGDFATAGFYNVPDSVFSVTPSVNFSSLRNFLKWLEVEGFPIYAVPLSKVVDVDLPKDIKIAEKFLMP